MRSALTVVAALALPHRHLCVPTQHALQELSGLAGPLAKLRIASVRKKAFILFHPEFSEFLLGDRYI